PAGGHAVEDLPLPGRELRERLGRRRPRGGEVAEHARGHARAEDRLARHDRPDRPVDLLLLGALEQVAAGARLHRGEDRVVVVVAHGADRRGVARLAHAASWFARLAPGRRRAWILGTRARSGASRGRSLASLTVPPGSLGSLAAAAAPGSLALAQGPARAAAA